MEPPPSYFSHSFQSPPTPRESDTASIRSAAPSYTSEAPSYVSTLPSSASSPSYTPSSRAPLHNHRSRAPSLDQFRIPAWSTTTSHNPAARHYHAVAHRRATIATALSQHEVITAAMSGEEGIKNMQAKMAEEEEKRLRPLEDPYLVGEEAAERARQERLARENGMGVLIREDQRWDWLLNQMKDWEERDRSWKKFRREVENGKRGKLARRLGL
ncbi:hypothetical protein F5884DRAFT_234796 [Xylogone sp. PMI_703]|nr:hypothetical protein F5884DRAFT_234796 [Xylogone sp. PMI_703]